MPWTPSDAAHKTKKAHSITQKNAWAATANAILRKTGDEAKAIRIANAMVKRHAHH